MSKRICPALVVCLLATCPLFAQDKETEKPSVFELPGLQARQAAQQAAILKLMGEGKYAESEALLQEAVKRNPLDMNSHYNLACSLARQKKTGEAFTSLQQAVDLGFRNRQHIAADPDLENLRSDERFAAVLKSADIPLEVKPNVLRQTVEPTAPVDGEFVVSEKNVAWNPRIGMFQAFVKFADPAELKDPLPPIAVGLGESGDLLRKWYAEGSAAGNYGDLYDNHDTDHSNMNYKALPQITRVEFSEEVKQRRLHHGLQRFFLYNAVTIGNSSTALTSGPFWRCQGRLALTQPGIPERMYLQYRANQLYFYPEHRDHDPGHNGKDSGYGDVLPANTPYLIISQGSSGSDRAFMSAVAQTLAAFHPEVKRSLAKAGLLMPTVQMIFRSSNKQVQKPDDYLTGIAHPTVFDGNQIDVLKMITMAHGMRPGVLPPLAQISVKEEDEGVLGRDYFDISAREKLFDTPCAIGRVVKSTKYIHRMVVSAEGSMDANELPLTYHWSVLRGDADRIQIKPLNDAGSLVEILVPYHERAKVPGSETMESNRVDIGAFVHNGTYYSAPAFISLQYLDNELRKYDEAGRIVSVDYTDPLVSGNYVDPFLDLKKDWRDEYHYSQNGELLGWTRTRGDERQEFSPEGLLILEPATDKKPATKVAVKYVASQAERNRAPLLKQEVITADQ